jgi:hypothetical protein
MGAVTVAPGELNGGQSALQNYSLPPKRSLF